MFLSISASVLFLLLFFFFFFKQKTAYEMRISDWSSDVCSSDLGRPRRSPATPAGSPGTTTSPGWMASCAHPSDSETPQGMTVQPRSRKSRLLGLLPSRLVMTRLPSRGKRLYLTFD